MGIKADVYFRELPVTGAYVRLSRVFGGKDEGTWNGVAQLYAGEDKCYPEGRVLTRQRPAAEQPVPNEQNPNPAIEMEDYEVPASPSGKHLDTFNVSAPFVASDPFPAVWAAIKEKLAGQYVATNMEDVK